MEHIHIRYIHDNLKPRITVFAIILTTLALGFCCVFVDVRIAHVHNPRPTPTPPATETTLAALSANPAIAVATHSKETHVAHEEGAHPSEVHTETREAKQVTLMSNAKNEEAKKEAKQKGEKPAPPGLDAVEETPAQAEKTKADDDEYEKAGDTTNEATNALVADESEATATNNKASRAEGEAHTGVTVIEAESAPIENVVESHTANTIGEGVQFGRDVLLGDASYRALIEGKRVAIVAHNASRATIDKLIEEGINLVAIFAPEHGFDTTIGAGEHVGDDDYRGIPVYSLYGGSFKPGREELNGVDVLLFELQDVGVRPYTYVSTMFLTMQAAAERGIHYVVLDRPVIIGGEKVEGPMLNLAWQSFIGIARIPNRYGMTIGELSLLFKGEPAILRGKLYTPRLENLRLTVVPMKNYDRSKHYDELPNVPRFVPPSPNVRHVHQALCLGLSGLFDGTDIISSVEGSDELFTSITVPWIASEGEMTRFVAYAQSVYAFPGVTLRRYTHVKNALYFDITDRNAFSPIRSALAILYTVKALYPSRSIIKAGSTRGRRMFTLGMGSSWLISRLDGGTLPSFQELLAYEEQGLDHFKALREKYLLY